MVGKSILTTGWPAFTLVELLVVITIIVVLLALLAPALDKAIYQAELTLCMTQQRNIVGGVSQYALNYRRQYPPRVGSGGGSVNNAIAYQDLGSGQYLDERPALRPYLDINLLVDPLTEPVDLDQTDPYKQSSVHASYNLYYGWRFAENISEARGARRMRMGDTFTYDGRRLKVMTADWDRVNKVDVENLGSHPDHGGIRVNKVRQDEPVDDALPVAAGIASLVISWWDNRQVFERPPVDTNAAFEDGSASTAYDVRWNEWDLDPRVAKLPEFGNNNAFYLDWYVQVPVH
jgi:type II secretory pathway pseudopilin PulG